MKKHLLTLGFAVLALAPIQTAHANEDPILTLPDGQVILSISATERREVEQDLLVATLSYTVINADNRAVQNEINEVMTKALARAKKEKDLKVNTGSYQVYEYTVPRSKEKKWRGSQSLTLKSMDADTVLETVGDLQSMKLTVSGLSYTLAPKTAIAVQDSLMEDALKQLQERANRAATALGKSKAELRDVNVNSSGIPYARTRNYARSSMVMADKAEMAAPVASAGESTITLTVTARAILKK